MAGALVGGSFLSAFLQVLFDRLASREFADLFKRQKLNDQLLGKLKTTMASVNRLLDDAEEKRIRDPDVETWLLDLKDAVYEADDLLDEIAYKALRSAAEVKSKVLTNKVRTIFSSRRLFDNGVKKMEAKLEMVLVRLKDLVELKDVLGLGECVGKRLPLQKTPSTSLVDESGVYGRNGDKESIIKFLLSDHANRRSPGVVPIVGMCGVGKTTLAQLVYNDSSVQEWFDLKAWVCVSDEFDVFKITKDILKELGSKNCDTKTQNQLHLELKDRLRGKKYLLVLDDVWNDCCYDDWELLLTPLKRGGHECGGHESKIIVTTRNQSVASVMCSAPIHHLNGLTDADCWSLFENHAFAYGSSVAYPSLVTIGKDIVRKCKGLPLAVKSVGGLLRTKRDVEYWEKILRSDMWDLPKNNILPALRLSYYFLPSHLKRCFSYCAIFPKDYKFLKEELVLLWMAEGFLVQLKGGKGTEEVGEEYFNDLVSRSFFQQSSSHSPYFIMHDLMNDLAKYVSGEFCFTLEDANTRKIAKRARHLSYVRTNNCTLKKFEGTLETQFIRTFFLVEQSWERDHKEHEVLHLLLPKLKRLRVLSLSQYCYIDELPDSVAKLKHLRYLNIFKASTKHLPRIVSTLYNLQTLILRECKDLIELPSSIGNLKHLQYLDLFGTSIRKLPGFVSDLCNLQTLILCQCKDLVELPTNMWRLVRLLHLDIRETSLQEMPLRLGELKNLRSLSKFINTGCRIKELGELHYLRGTLEIWNLQNVVDALDAQKANLRGKKFLDSLYLRWDGDTGNSLLEREVLEQLQPHVNVEYLSIVGYAGIAFPDWVGDPLFSNIVSLTLDGCKYCSTLPPLGQLSSLRYLLIEAFDGLAAIGSEFYGHCIKPFGSLEQLSFARMPQLQEWISNVEGAFPLLRELHMKQCPNLTQSLPNDLPSLTTLEIEGCQQLVVSLPRAPLILRMKLADDSRDVLLTKLPSGLYSLRVDGFDSIHSMLAEMEQMGVLHTTIEEVEIRSCDSLISFPLQLFSGLKSFRISECPNLDSFVSVEPTHGNLSSLSSLTISECPSFLVFPEGGLPAPNLTLLRLWNCSNLKFLPECMGSLLPSLSILQIVNCPELGSFPKGGLPSNLESLQVRNCNKLIAGRMQWNLQALPCLSQFSFGEYDDMASFPENGLLPSTLITLGIWVLPNLVSLNYQGLQHLTSLTQFRISHCPKLQAMPEQGLPSSLSSLTITECPLLEQRCRHEKGEDWPKISHIPDIEINLSI